MPPSPRFSALPWWIDELPTNPHRTTKHQAKSGAMTTGPGDHHNRKPTGGVLLYSMPIRCNDYPTSAAPTEPPREANTQKGVLRESGDAPPAAGGASRFRGNQRSAAGGRVSELISRKGPGWQARAAPVNRFGPTVSKSGTIGGPDQGPGIVAPQRWATSPLRGGAGSACGRVTGVPSSRHSRCGLR